MESNRIQSNELDTLNPQVIAVSGPSAANGDLNSPQNPTTNNHEDNKNNENNESDAPIMVQKQTEINTTKPELKPITIDYNGFKLELEVTDEETKIIPENSLLSRLPLNPLTDFQDINHIYITRESDAFHTIDECNVLKSNYKVYKENDVNPKNPIHLFTAKRFRRPLLCSPCYMLVFPMCCALADPILYQMDFQNAREKEIGKMGKILNLQCCKCDCRCKCCNCECCPCCFVKDWMSIRITDNKNGGFHDGLYSGTVIIPGCCKYSPHSCCCDQIGDYYDSTFQLKYRLVRKGCTANNYCYDCCKPCRCYDEIIDIYKGYSLDLAGKIEIKVGNCCCNCNCNKLVGSEICCECCCWTCEIPVEVLKFDIMFFDPEMTSLDKYNLIATSLAFDKEYNKL